MTRLLRDIANFIINQKLKISKPGFFKIQAELFSFRGF